MSRKTAFITGASRGIGAETAVALARAGYDVAITARTVAEGEAHDHGGKVAPLPGSLEATAEAVRREGGRALPIASDILDEASVVAAAAAAVDEFGGIDLLFNNAVYQGAGNLARLEDVTREQFDAILQGNLFTPLALVKAVLPGMCERGGGTILNMVSATAFLNPPAPADRGGWGFAYPASKAALVRMAGSLRAEYPDAGLRCYNVEPGTVVTEVMKSLGITEEIMQRYKPCSPAAIASVIAWLAENEPWDAWLGEDVLRCPAIARDLGTLAIPSYLES